MTPDPRRDPVVESLRGLACLLLVLYHVRGGDPESGLRLRSDNPWSYAVDSLVYVRMPLFTFLSGYVYARRPLRGRYWSFVRGKARRLLVPMLVIGTTFALTQAAAGGMVNGTSAQPWYTWHVLPIGHFWFLESVFWVFLLVAGLDRSSLLQRPTALVTAVVVVIAVDVVLPYGNNLLGLRTAVYLLPFFLTGVAAHRLSWRTAPLPLRAAVIVVAVGLTAVTQLGLTGVLPPVPARKDPWAAALGITGCLSLLLLPWRSRPLMVIGSFSFTIYTCHVFATSGARVVLTALGLGSTTVNVLVGVVAGVCFGIAVELAARSHRWTRVLVLGQRLTPRSSRDGAPGLGAVHLPARMPAEPSPRARSRTDSPLPASSTQRCHGSS